MSFIERKKQEVKCTKVEILIPGANNFIEREEIDEILSSSYGSLVGKDLSQINIHQVEKAIKANPYIAFVKVYADMDKPEYYGSIFSAMLRAGGKTRKDLKGVIALVESA